MSKIIIVNSCNECPYCTGNYTPNLKVYVGSSCKHPSNVNGNRIYLGGYVDRQKIHKKCPLEDNHESNQEETKNKTEE